MLKNLKNNLFFIISAMAYISLGFENSLEYYLGAAITFVIMTVILAGVPSVWNAFKELPLGIKIFSLISGVGICLASQQQCSNRTYGIIGAVLALYFAILCIAFFWAKLIAFFKENETFQDITKGEIVLYALMVGVSLGYMMNAYLKGNAFYWADEQRDIIYTSNAYELLKNNIYVTQPLFAILSGPFMAISYLIGRVFGLSVAVRAILLNIPMVVMLWMASFMIAKAMKIDSIKRICFMIVSGFTYTQLLFILMLERYVIGYFWLALCFYCICKNKKTNRSVLWGTIGVLVTSMMYLVPQFSHDMGKGIGLKDKIYQYVAFIRNCFVAPKAGTTLNDELKLSWHLETVTTLEVLGIVILVLSIFSMVVNYKKKSSLLAGIWIALSAVLLVGFGWGASQDGMIMYSLYYGWAFLVLLFQLVEKIEERLDIKLVVPVLSALVVITLAIINFPAIREVIRFSNLYFPR